MPAGIDTNSVKRAREKKCSSWLRRPGIPLQFEEKKSSSSTSPASATSPCQPQSDKRRTSNGELPETNKEAKNLCAGLFTVAELPPQHLALIYLAIIPFILPSHPGDSWSTQAGASATPYRAPGAYNSCALSNTPVYANHILQTRKVPPQFASMSSSLSYQSDRRPICCNGNCSNCPSGIQSRNTRYKRLKDPIGRDCFG